MVGDLTFKTIIMIDLNQEIGVSTRVTDHSKEMVVKEEVGIKVNIKTELQLLLEESKRIINLIWKSR